MVTVAVTNAAYTRFTEPNTTHNTSVLAIYNYLTDPTNVYVTIPFNIAGKTNILFWFYIDSVYDDEFSVYECNSFVETNITWNNAPLTLNFLGHQYPANVGWNYFDVSNTTSQNIMFLDSQSRDTTLIASDEAANAPYFTYDLAPVDINCPTGFTFVAQDTASRTLSEWETFSTPSSIQSHYNLTGHVYKTHKTGFDFNKTETVNQKEGVGLYFNTPTTITLSVGVGISVTLKTGWNLVGNFEGSDRTLGTLKTSIGGKAVSASYFNKLTQTFQTSDSTIVPSMEAFFVNVSGDVVWAG